MTNSASKAMAFALAYAEHRVFVKRSLRSFGVIAADADDALQQVFLVVHRRLDQYLEIPAKRGWLFAVSRFVSNNYRRKIRRARIGARFLITAPAPDTEELYARREAGRLLAAFLQQLPDKERGPFQLTHIEGLTADEVGMRLRVNPNTVRTRLRAARLRFQAELAGKG
jgi:RNA polymerase sigma-70 factor (ECF subfamily)